MSQKKKARAGFCPQRAMCIIRLSFLFVYIGLTAYCMSAGSVTLLSHVIKAQMHIQKLAGFSKTNKNIAVLSIGGPLLS